MKHSHFTTPRQLADAQFDGVHGGPLEPTWFEKCCRVVWNALAVLGLFAVCAMAGLYLGFKWYDEARVVKSDAALCDSCKKGENK